MRITSSTFVKSLTHAQEAPSHPPSFAMIGRSNVGKSSLINSLLQRKNLARTSSVPGKTQLINYFLVNNSWFLVDLPGYGWAQASKASRLKWEKMVKTYLSQAPITTLFILLDSRHPLQHIDLNFMEWVVKAKLPYGLVLTKADKCKQKEISAHIRLLKKELEARKWPLPPLFVTSSTSAAHKAAPDGPNEILAYIHERLQAKQG